MILKLLVVLDPGISGLMPYASFNIVISIRSNKATCVDFLYATHPGFTPRDTYIEGGILLDASDYENFESLESEFGEIKLIYMGIWGECVL